MVCALLLMLAPRGTAQNYEITFSGSGLSTSVATVEVWNLTADTTFSMSGSDTLLLVRPVGIKTASQTDLGMSIYPNPAHNSGTLTFSNPEAGRVSVDVFDVSGKQLVSWQQILPPGNQLFQIEGMGTGMFMVKVSTPQHSATTKWVTYASGTTHPTVSWIGNAGQTRTFRTLSGSKSTIELDYQDGDQLMFKGVSGNYSRIITLVATQSENIDFEFIACTDEDNNHYTVVTIGNQTWMASNLKTTKYNDGTPIPEVTEANSWANTTTPAYCWYDNDPANASVYGALYKWQTVDGGDLCPTGWRVPTTTDWTVLVNYLGADTLAGGMLKETGTQHWDTLMPGTTNSTGFTALPGGMRSVSGGTFQNKGSHAYFWTSEDYSAHFAHMRYMTYNSNAFSAAGNNKGNGFSVRCVKE